MTNIHQFKKICLEWEITKGNSRVHENFDNAAVYLFIVSKENTYYCRCKAKDGIIYANIPEDVVIHNINDNSVIYPIDGLPTGVYHVKAIWIKDWAVDDREPITYALNGCPPSNPHYDGCPPHGVGNGLYYGNHCHVDDCGCHGHHHDYHYHHHHHSCDCNGLYGHEHRPHHDPHVNPYMAPCYIGHFTVLGHKIACAERNEAFAIVDNWSHDNSGSTESTTLRFLTPAATYGYDGMSAYESAITHGKFEGSETDWLDYVMNGGSDGAALAAEIKRAMIAEAELRQLINSEITRAKEAEKTLGTNINTVGNNLTSEITRAKKAEKELNDKINKLGTGGGTGGGTNPPTDIPTGYNINFVEISREAYAALATKEPNTMYCYTN